MKKALRLTAFLLALVMMVAAFAACKGGKTGGKGDGEDYELSGAQLKWADMFGEEYVAARAKYEEEHPPYQVPEELKGTTVKFATWIDHTTTEAKYPMANFEKVTGIKVEWVEVPQGTYLSKIASMIATGDAPDVYVENNEFFPSTLTISKPLNEVKSIDMNDPVWDKGYFDFTTFNGKTYQLNAAKSVWQTVNLAFYNKQTMEENGIKTPAEYIEEGEWNFDNFKKVMTDFKQLGDSYIGGQYDAHIMAMTLGSAMAYMKDGQMVTGLKDQNFMKAYDLYYELQDAKLMGGSQAGLMKGTTGFYFIDSFGLKKTGYFKGVDEGVLGYAPIPTVDGIDGKISSHYRAYGIVSGAKNPEGAGYFLRFFLDPYNYNWSDIFFDEEGLQAYLDYAANVDFEDKIFDFQYAITAQLGYNDWEGKHVWDATLLRTNAAQLQSRADSIYSEVSNGCKYANDIIAGLK